MQVWPISAFSRTVANRNLTWSRKTKMKAIAGVFNEGGTAYTYLTTESIALGDYAIVPAASRYDMPKVVRIIALDEDFQMPDPPPFRYKRVIASFTVEQLQEALK